MTGKPERGSQVSEEDARAEYGKVVQSAKLQDIKLVSSSFGVEVGYFEEGKGESAESRDLNYSYGCENITVSYDADDGALAGQFEWSAIAERGDTEVLRIGGTYLVVYVCDVGLDESASKRFVERVGRYAIFPYFRTLVSFFGTASGLDMPILPVLKD